MQGEDEAKPKKQDTSKMTPSTVAYLESGADSAAPADGDREYALAPHVQEQIGRRLAAVYDEILRQPIPERFLRLLDQLDQATYQDGEGPVTCEGEGDGNSRSSGSDGQDDEATVIGQGDGN